MAAAKVWHNDTDVKLAVQDFHDACATNAETEREREIHTKILGIIEAELRKEGIVPLGTMNDFAQMSASVKPGKGRRRASDGYHNAGTLDRFEYVGSSYDGVKIARDGCEFDILVILKGGKTLQATRHRPGYCKIQPKDAAKNPFSGITDTNGLVCPKLAMQKFTGRLQKIINDFRVQNPVSYNYDIRLVSHGPATEMDIYDGGKKIYSVDMVPTFETCGSQFVAKPFRDYKSATSDNWRVSHAMKEKEKFAGIDRGNCCRKQVLRVCKAMRVDSLELLQITSYHLKNALFFEDNAHQNSNHWHQDNLALRVFGLWERMELYLGRNKMPSYFSKRMNLLAQIDPATRKLLRNRIGHFCGSKDEFMKLIEQIKQLY